MSEISKLLQELRLQIREDIKESETKILEKLDDKVQHLQTEVEELKQKNFENDRRLSTLEREVRKRNLILFGIEESEKSYEELEMLVQKTIENQMAIKLNILELEFVRRMGKKTDRPRPIVFALSTLGKKIKILQNKKKLDTVNAYIKEDFPPDVLEKRKILQAELKQELEKGNKGRIQYDRLIITHQTKKRTLADSPENEKTEKLNSTSKSSATTTHGASKNQPRKKQKNEQQSKTSANLTTFFSKNKHTTKPDASKETKPVETENNNQRAPRLDSNSTTGPE